MGIKRATRASAGIASGVAKTPHTEKYFLIAPLFYCKRRFSRARKSCRPVAQTLLLAVLANQIAEAQARPVLAARLLAGQLAKRACTIFNLLAALFMHGASGGRVARGIRLAVLARLLAICKRGRIEQGEYLQ